jgi:Zn-dependent protease with chaperone function
MSLDAGVIAIFVLAVLLAFVPALVDRWALARGASPQTLAALAVVTLVGVAAVPVAFVLCTAGLAAANAGRGGPDALAVAGLLLVAVAAGRTLARVIAIRRRLRALSRVVAGLDLPVIDGGVKVLPVGELLAFATGTEAFVSQGLLDRLAPAQRRAVIEHEREHANRRHARVLGTARALTHGSFGVLPARRAAAALARELDALADLAAASRVGDPQAVRVALQAIAAAQAEETTPAEWATVRDRIERLAVSRAPQRSLVDRTVRVVTLGLAALVLAVICLSIHTRTLWLGAAACLLLTASVVTFAGPALTSHSAAFDAGAESTQAHHRESHQDQ